MTTSLPLLPTVPLSDPRERNDAMFHWVILLVCSAVLISAALLTVGDSGVGNSSVVVPGLNQRLPELCMLRRVTGLSCPGCGLTRCFISLAHGDIVAAWSFNPAGLWLFAIIAAQLPLQSYQLWRINHGRRELPLVGLGAIAFGVFLVALLSQWALRLANAYL
jgi:hypothetical protein